MNSAQPALQGLRSRGPHLLLTECQPVLQAVMQLAHLSCPSSHLECNRPVPLMYHLTLSCLRRTPADSHRVSSPSTVQLAKSTHPGLPHPVRSAYRLSQPLSGLLLHQPGGPVSCLKRPWGSSRKVFLTPIRAPLGVAPLLPLDRYAAHHLHGAVDSLPSTRRHPPNPISTSGVYPAVSLFTCLWCYPLHRVDPLESAAL